MPALPKITNFISKSIQMLYVLTRLESLDIIYANSFHAYWNIVIIKTVIEANLLATANNPLSAGPKTFVINNLEKPDNNQYEIAAKHRGIENLIIFKIAFLLICAILKFPSALYLNSIMSIWTNIPIAGDKYNDLTSQLNTKIKIILITAVSKVFINPEITYNLLFKNARHI